MACANPYPVKMSTKPWTHTGKYVIAFSTKSERYRTAHFRDGLEFAPFDMPCGKCSPCRKKAARNKAILAQKEGQTHEKTSFITLTYSPENLPAGGALVRRHWQNFAKRLRERLRDLGHPPVRFFYCGEYGTKSLRPHFHALIYGFDFGADRRYLKGSGEKTLYRSPLLESLWPFGHSSVGSVSMASCAYVSSYVLKKNTRHEERIKSAGLPPEFARGSNFLGKAWLQKYYKDVYPGRGKAGVRIGDKVVAPPKQFDRWMDQIDPKRIAEVRDRRRIDAEKRLKEELALPRMIWFYKQKEKKRAREVAEYSDALKISRSMEGATL